MGRSRQVVAWVRGEEEEACGAGKGGGEGEGVARSLLPPLRGPPHGRCMDLPESAGVGGEVVTMPRLVDLRDE